MINSTDKHSKLKCAARGNQAVLFLKERQEIRLSHVFSNVYSKSAKLMVLAERNSTLTVLQASYPNINFLTAVFAIYFVDLPKLSQLNFLMSANICVAKNKKVNDFSHF